MDKDTIAILISLFALAVSIIIPIFEQISNNRMNITNLEAEYFRNAYSEFLMQDIPAAREKIIFNGQNVSGTDDLIDVLRELRKKSIYFKSMHTKFYNCLLGKIQELEDYIIIEEPHINYQWDFLLFENTVQSKLSEVYEIITKQYLGKKNT